MISLAIPYYNRCKVISEVLKYPILDSRISEIVICDDYSIGNDISKLLNIIKKIPKIKLYRNCENIHALHNKKNAVSFCTNEWVYLLDSDNIIDKSTIDGIFNIDNLNENTIYAPSFAYPDFDYTHFLNKDININTIQFLITQPLFNVLLNTGNFFFNKQSYLDSYVYNSTCKAADVICFLYKWMLDGKNIKICDYKYYHTVHNNSTYLKELQYNLEQSEYWFNRVKELWRIH